MSEIQTYRVFAGPMFVGRLHVNHAPLNPIAQSLGVAYHLFIDREGNSIEHYGSIERVQSYRNLQLQRVDPMVRWD